MDKFIQDTVLKDYPQMEKNDEDTSKEQNTNPSIVRAEVTRKRSSPKKQSNQVCF